MIGKGFDSPTGGWYDAVAELDRQRSAKAFYAGSTPVCVLEATMKHKINAALNAPNEETFIALFKEYAEKAILGDTASMEVYFGLVDLCAPELDPEPEGWHKDMFGEGFREARNFIEELQQLDVTEGERLEIFGRFMKKWHNKKQDSF